MGKTEEMFVASLVLLWSSRRTLDLLRVLGDEKHMLEASKEELCQKACLTEAQIEHFISFRSSRNWEEECRSMQAKEIQLVTWGKPRYPSALMELPDAPYGLFFLGDLPRDENLVGIVGARECTEYGREMAGKIGEYLGKGGYAVVSGMARGIDSAGHFGALRGNGKTYAVLGCGVDICYPPGNKGLYEKIKKSGGVISEYPPGTPPIPRNFPERNRIISGLCQKLVVVEAREKSGSLITADAALEQGKDIYAVPGRIGDRLSEGCNRLIGQGAGIILSPEELIKEWGFVSVNKIDLPKKTKNSLEKEESLLYALVDLHPKSVDEIVELSGMDYRSCILALAGLRDKGFIREIYQNYYIRDLE